MIADRAKTAAREGRLASGDSMLMIGMVFMLYVDDCDAWYARAMKAEGAVLIGVPADQPYGDRVGAVKDPFDNLWYIGTHLAPRESEPAGK
jgi:uncharacterized glyoxalase superfamily protein PhnB